MRRAIFTIIGLGWVAMFQAGVSSAERQQEPAAAEGWVALPDEGETSARAFAVVDNPTMYDIYLVSAASEIADKVEFRDASNGESEARREVTVPAYGKISMASDGVHLVLVDLKRPLQEGESVPITLRTDGNVELRIQAAVRRENR